MIEEVGRVVAIEGGFVSVESERRPACGGCAANGACGTFSLAKLFAERRNRVRVEDTVGVSVGDAVVVGIREETFLQASFLAYGVPLLMLAMAGLGAAGLGFGDEMCLLAAFAGLAAGFVFSNRVANLGRTSDYAPVLLARHGEGGTPAKGNLAREDSALRDRTCGSPLARPGTLGKENQLFVQQWRS